MKHLAPFRIVATVAACATLACPFAIWAKDKPLPESAYVEALKACQAEQTDAVRLACFDKAVSGILAANESGDVRVVDRAEVQQTRRSLFGFSLPDFGIFKGRDTREEEEIKSLDTTIASVRPSDNRGWLLTTAEGAVWRIDNVPNRLMTPKAGQKLEIRAGALSSYFLRINGQGGIKGKRIN